MDIKPERAAVHERSRNTTTEAIVPASVGGDPPRRAAVDPGGHCAEPFRWASALRDASLEWAGASSAWSSRRATDQARKRTRRRVSNKAQDLFTEAA